MHDADENASSDIPLGQPRFRWDELTDANSKYERAVAAPSDAALVRMWTGWSVVSFFCGTVALVVFIAMLTKRNVRTNAFNLYIMAIALPDFVPAILCGITCALNAAAGHFISSEQCAFQAVYVTFNVSCNSWMNALICSEINRLLRCSSRRERYFPPTCGKVIQKSIVVYLFSGLICTMPLWPFDWVLINVDVAGAGGGCNASYYSMESELFFWFVACPLLLGIPYVYVMWVAWDVYQRQLLPPRGYRRELSVYYFKIIFVVFFIWLPFLVVYVALRGRVNPWVVWAMGSLAHSQTLISALLACQKQDIRSAVLEFFCCNSFSSSNEIDSSSNSRGKKSGSPSSKGGGGVCHGDFPQQREDYGFDGETTVDDAIASPDSMIDVLEDVQEDVREQAV